MAVPRGKKRDGLGVVHDRQNDTTHAASLPFSSKEVQGPKEVDKILQEEVRALGGTTEDLLLLEGLDSDSELEGTEVRNPNRKEKKGISNGLKKGMSNILKEITLVQTQVSTLSESSDMSDGDDKDEDDSVEAVGRTLRPDTFFIMT